MEATITEIQSNSKVQILILILILILSPNRVKTLIVEERM